MTDIERFIQSLGFGKEPVQKLRQFVREVEKREANLSNPGLGIGSHASAFANQQAANQPTALELFLAHELREAGVFDLPQQMPPLKATVLKNSHMAYLAMFDERVSWDAKTAVMRIENALNRAQFAERAMQEGFLLPAATEADFYLFNTRLEKNIAMQLNVLNLETAHQTQNLKGEWDVRYAFASALEEFSLPYRFQGDFRLNLKEGLLGVEIEAMPPEAIATNILREGTTTLSKRSRTEKEQAATDLLAREILMTALVATTLSQEIEEIWIKGIHKDHKNHLCLVSALFSAKDIARLTKDDFVFPLKTLENLGATCQIENAIFTPVTPTFSLNDERLCPPYRKEQPELSSSVLTPEQAKALGAEVVSDLAINEGRARSLIAEKILRNLSDSTQQNVSMILELTRNNVDEKIRKAGEDISEKLIEGELTEANWDVLLEEFQEGDSLSKAVKRAMKAQKDGGGVPFQEIEAELKALDEAHTYDDTDEVVWRTFNSYTDRVLYNRLCEGNRAVKLVPEAYYLAHLLSAVGLLAEKNAEGALLHALRACELNPMDATAHLYASKAYEQLNDLEMAASTMQELLQYAHHPEAIALGYYRLAYLIWHLGDTNQADALYRLSMQFPTPIAGMAQMELLTMESQTNQRPIETDEIKEILSQHSIPLAPTKQVGDILLEAAKASVDAAIFLVAADICALVGVLSSGDAMVDVAKSIAHEVL